MEYDAVLFREIAIECGDDSTCEGLVEAEGVSDGEDFLSDFKVGGGTDGDGVEVGGGGSNAEDGEIVVTRSADDDGVDGLFIREGDDDSLSAFDDVVVGDDVPFIVPDEAGSGATRDGLDLPGAPIAAVLGVGYEDDGWSDVFEELGGGFFEFHEVAARVDGT